MNERSDIDRVLLEWFDDGPSRMPDRVVDVVADRIARERQRPAWRLRWRETDMHPLVKFGAAIAAVLVIAVIGWNLLPGGRTGIGGASQSPSRSTAPSATPSTTPSASIAAVFPDWYTQGATTCDPNCAGELSAGTHTSRFFVPAVTYTVPAGWINGSDADFGYDLFPDTPSNQAEFARSNDVDQNIAISATDGWADDWGICPGRYTWGDALTAAEIIGALTASKNLVTTAPVPVTIGGLTGQQLDIHLSPSWTGTCPLDPEDPPDKDFKDIRLRLLVLDFPDGSDVVPILIQSLHAAEFDAFVADATPIVESFEFDFGPGTLPSPS